MAQNIYDDEAFFTAYSALRRSVGGLESAPEWPTLREMLPRVEGARVLDLGCGFGWFCRWAADHGAASVLGVDLSARMLERAQRETGAERIEYLRADLERLELPASAFDLAYSSLTLHYLHDLDRFLGRVHAALAPGGSFVCSLEHPVFTAPTRPGFVDGPAGTPVWPVDAYLDEGRRVTDWLAPGIVKVHRTLGTYVTSLLGAGFRLTHLVEWAPSPEQVAEVPEWQAERTRPSFLLLAAER